MDISNWINRWAAFAPERPALRYQGREISYAALAGRIEKLAGALAELGIGPGDRVAQLGYNSPEIVDLLFACARLGAIMVPLNWRLAGPEIAYILDDSEPKAVLAEPDFIALLDELRKGRQAAWIAYEGADGWLDYRQLIKGAEAPPPPRAGGPIDAVLIVYTSGTTGRPKGAVLDQNAIFHNAVNGAAAFDLGSTDQVLTAIPMFHVGGLNIQTTPALHAGATVTILQKFDPAEMLATIAAERITLAIAVPAMLLALIGHPDWAGADLSSLRCLTSGSSTVPDALIAAVLARDVAMSQVYGSTETAPTVIVGLPSKDARVAGSCGHAALHCEARINDDEGNEVPAGRAGEIVVRGANIMREYWRQPEATAEALRDGWFHTGDIGHRGPDGAFYVDDRKKDMIISGSENIYSAELEFVLAECANLAESTVVARPDERWGEVPVAVVVKLPDSEITKAEVLDLFADRLARYKHPKDVLFTDALPRNAMGKVLKFEVREMLRKG